MNKISEIYNSNIIDYYIELKYLKLESNWNLNYMVDSSK